MQPSTTTKVNENITLQVMRLLEENPDMTQRELARALGVSVGGLNFCLNALIEKGWVKMKNFAHSKNKFGYVYVLTPRGVGERAELTQRFLVRKMAEYEALRSEIERLRGDVAADVALGRVGRVGGVGASGSSGEIQS